jgi:hypothetical protein
MSYLKPTSLVQNAFAGIQKSQKTQITTTGFHRKLLCFGHFNLTLILCGKKYEVEGP